MFTFDSRAIFSDAQSLVYRLGSRFRVNETSQISERYSVYIYALTKEKKLTTVALILISTIKCQKYD